MIKLGKTSKGAGIKPVALPKTSIKGLGDISGATQDTLKPLLVALCVTT
jgi:hypothetical protein